MTNPKLSKMNKRKITGGVARIAIERARQMESEHWTAEHDDEHIRGELAMAAACYANPSHTKELPALFPFDECWWKPTPNDRIKELTKAGALIAAEIDRLLRAECEEKGIFSVIDVLPNDGERVLVWNNMCSRWHILTYNKPGQCWNTEDDSNWAYGLDELVEGTDVLAIEYWKPLPQKIR